MVVECEFSFELRADLPARPAPYARDEVAAAVRGVHASIEVVAGHLEDWIHQDVWSVIADNGTDGAEIVGSGCALHGQDLAAVPVTLERNGEVVREGSGADVLGDPLDALHWLANARRAAGDGLRADMRCNTGTATAICPVGRGDHLVATFGGVGVAELRIV